MNRLPTIPLEPRDGGALSWFDYLDDDLRVPIGFFGGHYPKTPTQRRAWLIRMLREQDHNRLFFRLLAHRDMVLDFQLTEVKKTGWPEYSHTVGTVPLAQLLSLPNVDPAEELEQMRGFLAWLDQQVAGNGRNGGDAHIQVFRGGYNSRGIEAAGFADPTKRETLEQDLKNWRKKAWFEAWYQTKMKELSRVRMNAHCWFPLDSLVEDRRYQAMLLKTRQEQIPQPKPSEPEEDRIVLVVGD